MESEKKINVNRGGIGLGGLVFIIFLILKLTGVVSWSWFIVCLPLIISAGLTILLTLLVFIIAIIVAAVND
jgi:hypothetical protein